MRNKGRKMPASLREEKLDFWIKNQQNVLFIGKHGVGKSSIIKQVFDKNNLKWMYFSAATMDPWIDFIGVPRENKNIESFEIIKELMKVNDDLAMKWIISNWKMDDNSAKEIITHLNKTKTETFLELVRPKAFAEDSVEALFFDEFNRAPKKVRNAVMELLQFKSINGKKFNNLKIIWAAINPEDEEGEYDVEKLDPAQKDRFHIINKIPYEPDGEFFKAKFGEHVAKVAIAWWRELPDEEKEKISPRRLEYALNVRQLDKGDMRDVFPKSAGVTKLIEAFKHGNTPDKLESLMKDGDVDIARQFLSHENNFSSSMKYIPASEIMMKFFLPLLNPEKLAKVMVEQESCCTYIIENSSAIPLFQSACKNILDANTNAKLVKRIRTVLTENESLAKSFGNSNKSPTKPFYNKGKKGIYNTTLMTLKNTDYNSASSKNFIYKEIENIIPEKMSADEAILTLELLSISFDTAWPATITSAKNLIGITNHCINEINRNTGYDWETILIQFGSKFKNLLNRIKEVGMIDQIVCPTRNCLSYK